jgi:hypothetical protein
MGAATSATTAFAALIYIAVGGSYSYRATAGHQDGFHSCVGPDHTAQRLESALEREGKVVRPALRHWKADVLPEHGQQPAEDSAACRVGRYVGVHGVAGEQQWATVTSELLGPESPHRQHGQSSQIEHACQLGSAKQFQG